MAWQGAGKLLDIDCLFEANSAHRSLAYASLQLVESAEHGKRGRARKLDRLLK